MAVVRGLPFYLVNLGKLSLISRVSDISLGTFYIYIKFLLEKHGFTFNHDPKL